MSFVKESYKGLLLCLAIAIPADILGKNFSLIGGPVFAILIGMVLTLFIKDKTMFEPGIRYTSKKIL
ncbi:MAG: putative sulfate exporter family transporter, partial [Lachnospiraceae bacterium]|nr:putative sulfate exporter family transporter [Lachnospiraceae bacterium]